jgi:hypothetical protein
VAAVHAVGHDADEVAPICVFDLRDDGGQRVPAKRPGVAMNWS